jgi:enoyl-CoA hydratase/carnithine racemase
MTDPTVLSRKADGVGWMTFSNPARHNALSDVMGLQVVEILADFAADPNVRLCVMTGAGEEAFVSGADIGGLSPRAQLAEDEAPPLLRAFQALADFEKPLAAMIRGWCLGGGLGVAIKADLRICATNARFGIPAARLGVGYPLDLTRELVALVGPAVAKSILFTAERLSAQKALEIGLVNEVTGPDGLECRMAEIAHSIARNAPLSIRTAKAAIDHIVRGSGSEAEIARLAARCFASADFEEGRTAFLEKRPPVFRGA